MRPRTILLITGLALTLGLANTPAVANDTCGPAISKDEVQYMTLRAHEAAILGELVRQSGFEIVSRADHVDAGEVSAKQKKMWGNMATGGGVLDEKAQIKRLAKAGCHGGILLIHSASTVAGETDRLSANQYGVYGNSQLETKTVADVTEYRLRKTRPDARLLPPEAVAAATTDSAPANQPPAQTESQPQPPTAAELAEITQKAEAGDAESQLILGLLYGNGLGVPRDLPMARQWVERSANQGFPNAQYTMGMMYHSGTGVPSDYVFAHAWFNVASASGHADARESLQALEANLTPDQLAEAQSMARGFKAVREN